MVNTALAVLDTTDATSSSTPASYLLSGSNPAFVKARSNLTPSRKTEIRAILDANYGRKDAEKEAKVKAVFNEIGIKDIYEEYEETIYKQLIDKIEGIPESEGKGGHILRKDVFKMFLSKIYKRQK